MGNGKSLEDVDFKDFDHPHIDTFGLNGAYRQYNRMNWYPTYFGCFDQQVNEYHKIPFYETVINNPIKKGFFRAEMPIHDKIQQIKLTRTGTKIGSNPFPTDYNDFYDGGNSGVNSVQCGIIMGYKKIVLVGTDCNYVEFLPEARMNSSGQLVIVETPKENPNYWFNDYQQKGDIYNVPRTDIYHLPGWIGLSKKAEQNNIDIVNCSPRSSLECFRKGDLKKELNI